MKQKRQQELWTLLEPIVESSGCELVDLELVEGKTPVLRATVDKPNLPLVQGIGVAPGDGVNLDECASISRQMSALLDVEDTIKHAFVLEVTSPGVQRPVRKPEDFAKFEGYPIHVRTEFPLEWDGPDSKRPPSRNFKGTLGPMKENKVVVVSEDGEEATIPLDAILRAKLDPDMDEWLALATKARATKGE
jgi:ribosome maturation factor RimP